jgi:hypothetical protein
VALNLPGAIQLVADDNVVELVQFHEDRSTAIAINVGKSGTERLTFCCCGRQSHGEMLRLAPFVSVGTTNSVLNWLERNFHIDVPPNTPDNSQQVLLDVIARAQKREERHDAKQKLEDKTVAVTLLLQEYGFLARNDPQITAAVMREFKQYQRQRYFFGANSWPKVLADQITFLYDRQNEMWRHKSE